MEDMTFQQILAISHVIPILLVLSIIMVMATLERIQYFMRKARVNGGALDKIRNNVKRGRMMEAKKEATGRGGLIFEGILAQIDALGSSRTERESLILFYHQRLQTLLQKRLWIFGTLSFICPLIGLLGTVMGVMTSFKDLALSGSGGPSIVAAGISEALWATAAGIGVAIIAAVLFNCFNVWMKGTLSSSDLFGQELILLTIDKKH